MVQCINAKQAAEWLANGEGILIDVREPDEFAAEHIAYASSVPLGQVDALLDAINIPAGKKLIFQCLKGKRGEDACVVVQKAGRVSQEHIYNIEGGISAWKEEGLPTVSSLKEAGMSIFRQVQVIVGGLIALLVVIGFSGLALGFMLAGFLGAALFMAGLTGWCGLAMVLRRMPWNKR